MTAQRPNILFIMSDDHAAKSISAYGAGINNTPHLDRIAKEGMLFNHCYVTNSICTPSRATILTGTHNHVNTVFTLASKINKQLPNVAKQLRSHGKYQTAIYGKWHLGEGDPSNPSGFNDWEIVPGQGHYFDPVFISEKGAHTESGYATEIITDKTINFIEKRDKSKPFFVMCHHKAPHRSWEAHPRHRNMYKTPIKVPDTFNDDYKNRAKAAGVAKMRVEMDMTYFDLGLAQPEGGTEVGQTMADGPHLRMIGDRKIPTPKDFANMRPLICKETGDKFTFKNAKEMSEWKYQRYMMRYLQTIQCIDDEVGRLLNYLDDNDLTKNTMVIYTSDQGFFLGEHGWFDKRFIYEESFQMPFLIRCPGLIKPGSVCDDIVSNVDFAPTWLQYAGLKVPSYMQGDSFLTSLKGENTGKENAVAYHRYWMHGDEFHNVYAHYGIRNQRYKIIFWYNAGYGLTGTREGGEEQEWELFDCEKDPMELFNVWSDPAYDEVRETMVRALEEKMEDIGDDPAHAVGLPGTELVKMYKEGSGIAAKAGENNLGAGPAGRNAF